MEFKELYRRIWKLISFLFLLYGFYLFFLFVWDTMVRVNERIAFPIALFSTFVLIVISTLLWLRKRSSKSDKTTSPGL